MNTTAPRARAGKPYVMPLHRFEPSQLTAHTVTGGEGSGYAVHIGFAKPEQPELQIDFVLPDEPEPAADATKDMKASEFAFWFWSRAMWTGCFFGLGILYARHFS